MPNFDLSQRVAFVTGGNGGIGLGMAKGMAEAGATVVIAGRNKAKAEKALVALRAFGGTADFVELDVLDEASCRKAIDDTAARFGRLDILVNNAGTSVRKQPQDLTSADWHHVMNTNLTSAFVCSQAAYPHMKAAGGGKIINIGSMMTIFAAPYATPYAASKGAIVQMARAMAMGVEAHVIVIDISLRRLYELDEQFGSRMHTLFSTIDAIEEQVVSADLVIGCVLLPGAAAPKLITEEMVKRMKKGSVIVDVAIDQGGCAETSHPTTHANPTYKVHDVVHYCVANMPGGVARTSTFALNNATLPFTVALAEKGPEAAMKANPHLMAGLNVYNGTLTYKAVADAQKLPFKSAADVLGT